MNFGSLNSIKILDFDMNSYFQSEIEVYEKLLKHYIPEENLKGCLEQLVAAYKFSLANCALAAAMDSEIANEAEEICNEQIKGFFDD